MKVIIQSVKRGWIKSWNGREELINVAAIKKGAIVYIGFCKGDTRTDVEKFVKKIFDFPIFDNKNGKISLSLKDIGGELIVVPNFTLCGRNKKGVSFDYSKAMDFEQGEELYNYLKDLLKSEAVYFGVFGSYMEIESVASGPINLMLDI